MLTPLSVCWLCLCTDSIVLTVCAMSALTASVLCADLCVSVLWLVCECPLTSVWVSSDFCVWVYYVYLCPVFCMSTASVSSASECTLPKWAHSHSYFTSMYFTHVCTVPSCAPLLCVHCLHVLYFCTLPSCTLLLCMYCLHVYWSSTSVCKLPPYAMLQCVFCLCELHAHVYFISVHSASVCILPLLHSVSLNVFYLYVPYFFVCFTSVCCTSRCILPLCTLLMCVFFMHLWSSDTF